MEKSTAHKRSFQSFDQDQESEKIVLVQRDPTNFGELYDQYAPAIYRYLLSRLGNVDEANDVTSQTFLKAVEIFPRYNHRGYFSAWLFSIALSKCVDHVRRNRRKIEKLQENMIDSQPDPLAIVMDIERKAVLMRCIRSLKPEEQELLRLRYVAGLSFVEMADLLKKHDDAVKKRMYRLLERLQKQMEDEDGCKRE